MFCVCWVRRLERTFSQKYIFFICRSLQVKFINYKSRIATSIRGLWWVKMTTVNLGLKGLTDYCLLKVAGSSPALVFKFRRNNVSSPLTRKYAVLWEASETELDLRPPENPDGVLNPVCDHSEMKLVRWITQLLFDRLEFSLILMEWASPFNITVFVAFTERVNIALRRFRVIRKPDVGTTPYS